MKQQKRRERERERLAVLDRAADVLDELDDGTFLDPAGLNSVIELSGEHRMLSRNGVGEQEPVPLLRVTDELDVQHLNERLRVHITGGDGCDRVRREVHRHFYTGGDGGEGRSGKSEIWWRSI